jgi:nitrogen fixation protein FixH
MNGKLTGAGVLLWLIGFFGVIIAVNAYFITVSITSFRGEDEQKPYLQGIEYNETLERRSEQAKLDWNATIAANRLPSGAVRVTVTILNSQGFPQPGAELSGELRHPADENRDHAIVLRDEGEGRYVAEVKGVAPGAWDVIVNSASRSKPFEAVRRLWVS